MQPPLNQAATHPSLCQATFPSHQQTSNQPLVPPQQAATISVQQQTLEHSLQSPPEHFVSILDEFYQSLSEVEDSDYISSTNLDGSSGSGSKIPCYDSSDVQIEAQAPTGKPSSNKSSIETGNVTPPTQTSTTIPPPPFKTPPKLKPVEEVMSDRTGSSVAALRSLTTALAKEAIFGREELARKSLSGRNNTGMLDPNKLSYIKTLVQSRVPSMSNHEFEHIWMLCRSSLSKSCQTLRTNMRGK